MRGLTTIEVATIEWWKMKRPVAWNEEQHLENPGINCSSPEEKALAIEVAFLLKKRIERQAKWAEKFEKEFGLKLR